MAAINFRTESVSFMKTLRPYALKLTSNRQDAQDLLQETLMKAFASRDKFKEGTNLKGWLYTIMRNTFITNYKKKGKKENFYRHDGRIGPYQYRPFSYEFRNICSRGRRDCKGGRKIILCV